MGIASKGITSADIIGAIGHLYQNQMLRTDSFAEVSGTWIFGGNAGFWNFNYLYVAVPAVNDEVSLGNFYVKVAGIYTIHILAAKRNDMGKAHFIINGVDVGTIDLYDAAAGKDNELLSVSTGALTVGLKQLRLKLSDKNGASSDYAIRLQGIFIV